MSYFIPIICSFSQQVCSYQDWQHIRWKHTGGTSLYQINGRTVNNCFYNQSGKSQGTGGINGSLLKLIIHVSKITVLWILAARMDISLRTRSFNEPNVHNMHVFAPRNVPLGKARILATCHQKRKSRTITSISLCKMPLFKSCSSQTMPTTVNW